MSSSNNIFAKIFKRKDSDNDSSQSLKDFSTTGFKKSVEYSDTNSTIGSIDTAYTNSNAKTTNSSVLDASKGGSAYDALSYFYDNYSGTMATDASAHSNRSRQ